MLKFSKRNRHKPIRPLSFSVYYYTILFLALVGLFSAVYLAHSHYRVYTDIAYKSFCAISKAMNCDTHLGHHRIHFFPAFNAAGEKQRRRLQTDLDPPFVDIIGIHIIQSHSGGNIDFLYTQLLHGLHLDLCRKPFASVLHKYDSKPL
jgi:hypothetical protein